MRLNKGNFVWLFLGFCITLSFLPRLPFLGNLTQTDHNLKSFIPKNSGYVVSPITINGNGDWASLNSSEPWCNGSGTPSSPYIIENIVVNGTECIKIINTDVHFIIRNCSLYSPTHGAIELRQVSNGKILNNEILNDYISLEISDYNNITGNTLHHGGIYVGSSSDHNTISNNTIINDHFGIALSGQGVTSTNITISDNIINTTTLDEDHIEFGVIIYSEFSDVKFFNNTLYGQGILIDDQSLAHASSHTINGNTINGKKIYYYKNVNGLNSDDFVDAGQIHLVNCDYSYISNLDLSYSGVGVSLYYSDHNNILNCNSSQKVFLSSSASYGVYLYDSDQNIIHGLFVSEGYAGICLEENSDFNSVNENILLNLHHYGIDIRNSNNNTISTNFIEDWGIHGIYIRDNGKGNNVSHNQIIDHHTGLDNGITVYAEFNRIFNNTLIQNGRGIELWSDNNLIVSNTIVQNQIGIDMSSNNNKVYLNNFSSNSVQAIDDGINNTWDNGSIGNCWDDYIGLDIDDDGIGDIPYLISGSANSQDNCPIFDDGIDPPDIVINSPIKNEVFGLNAPSFNVFITDENPINRTWYTIDGGISNFTFSGSSGIINQSAWNLNGNGSVIITFYANDSAGSLGSSSVTIWKDSLEPDIIINSPNSNQLCGITPPTFSLAINEPNFHKAWYNLNGGNNVSFTTQNQISQFEWEKFGNGTVTIGFYANDTVGNIGYSEVLVRKDTFEPVVIVNFPLDAQKFGDNPPQFNITVIEESSITCWYQIESNTNQYAFIGLIGTIDDDLWSGLPGGRVNLIFYARDEAGNIGSSMVSIIKESEELVISGYNIMLVYVICSVIIVLYKKKILKSNRIKSD